jgi:hypothetical protein
MYKDVFEDSDLLEFYALPLVKIKAVCGSYSTAAF